LVLCSAPFLHTLSVVEREVAHIAITDAASAQAAANLLQRLTGAGTALDKARLEVGAPFRAKLDEINTAAKAPAKRIEDAKGLIKKKVTDYSTEQARLAQEAERARLTEVARLEALARAEAMAAREKAAALAAKAVAVAPMMEFDDDEPAAPPPKTETELALEAARFAPAVAVTAPVGVAFRVTLVIDRIDVAKLPDTFVVRTANERGIRATFCQGYKEGDPMPECPGVAFRVVKEPISTGRAVF
jgi:hypothetical protein